MKMNDAYERKKNTFYFEIKSSVLRQNTQKVIFVYQVKNEK